MAGVQSFPVRSIEELVLVLQEMDKINPVIRLMLEFEARSGLRYVDVSAIKFSDVSINGVIRDSFSVVQSKGFNKRMTAFYRDNPTPESTNPAVIAAYKRVESKAKINARSASTVNISINTQLKQVIEDLRDINGKYLMMFQSSHHSAKPNRAITIQYINRVLKKVAFKLALPYALSTHSLRKTFVRFLIDMGADITVIMKGLGQSSLSSTQHYINTFDDNTKKFAENIEFSV